MKRIFALAAASALVAAFVINGLGGSASATLSGTTLRGAIGGDFDSELPGGSVNGADWGVIQTLKPKASPALNDAHVYAQVGTCKKPDNTTPCGSAVNNGDSESNPGCTGSVAVPTAPAGFVCIYVAGADNAANVAGVSIVPGTGASPFGFKLIWDSSAHNGDTFIDAVWAYKFP